MANFMLREFYLNKKSLKKICLNKKSELTKKNGAGWGGRVRLLGGTQPELVASQPPLQGAHGACFPVLNRTYVFLHSSEEHGFAQFEKSQKRKW